MLAPPALYIPRHCRGTPFERGRCRRDACTVMYISNAVSAMYVILVHRQRTATASPLLRGVRRSRGGMYPKTNTKSQNTKLGIVSLIEYDLQ